MRRDAEIKSEADLVRQAQAGDLDAFGSLVRLHEERAARVAASLVGFSEARDVVQEAFLDAWKNLAKFRFECRFYTWLYRIVTNRCRDFLRKRRVRGFILLFSGSRDAENTETPDAPSEEKNAREVLMNEELGAEIRRAMEKLPFRQRSAFALRYLEGLSIEEIAETMCCSAGAVKAHLWQAGQKMRSALSHARAG